MNNIGVSEKVKDSYNEFYSTDHNDWRMFAAEYKVQNIIDVCLSLQPKKVLEVGAGEGSVLHHLDRLNFAPQLFALEISDKGVTSIHKRNFKSLQEVVAFDGYSIPYPDASFDLIVLTHVLEHVEHERILLRELIRVAKYIVIEVPKDYRYGVDKRLKHFMDYGHINVYTPSLLRFLLKSEGLEIIRDKTVLYHPKLSNYHCKSFVKRNLTILEYFFKTFLGILFGRKIKEKYANAYTVLVKNNNNTLTIF